MEAVLDSVIILLLIVLNGLFALSELALVSANRARLAVLERKGVAGAALALELSEDPQRFLPTVQVGITVVAILSGVFGGARVADFVRPALEEVTWLRPFASSLSLAVVVIAITYLTLVIGELVPKQLALRSPERTAAVVAGPLVWLTRVSRPFVWVLGKSSALVLRIFGAHRDLPPPVTEEELKALLVEGEKTGVLESEERDMIERVLRLADKPVRAIMTPRTEIAWIDRTDPARDIAATLKSAPHSRFVVCDGSVDNVVGVVQAKDILDGVLDGKEVSIGAALRQPIVMPDTVTALDALERLKSDPLGLALVLDEYGSFEGVVTAADVLEAIIGDANDAAPGGGEGIEAVEGTYLLDGMMPVDEAKERLMLPDLPAAGSYHTIAGLLLALLRRVPRQGDRIVFAGWLFEVTEMDGRRVARVRASREPLAEG
ncbi:HlyC/CorC family transporter [Rhodovastum atsumiense]|uniref:HlyC/CorC family transporter n=1 Tax=Rhodovastum atsumiense TaxID=504468 RepID=A0A5M6IUV8_9PROT|nr:hemolysin family protein [Rhodovastum atsumiense]KAA5612076.1 HlyC/CorC family transporter [Rhodovastum atsumiense]CAH2604052.1 HlyC/CorC family transporter [Rhodovastum atsumiense]